MDKEQYNHMGEVNNKKKYKLSICMIVRDEEKFLDNCLKSLKPLIDSNLAELIIVDTGSVDRTVEIAKKYTDKLYFKKWNNNFSEARNYSISLAKGEYIFIMDADQEMEYSEVKKLIKLFSSNEYKQFNTYSLIYKNFTKEDLINYTYFSLNLIFKNDGYFRYEGKVHNQPIYRGPVKNLEIYMLHYGYIMTEDIKDKKFKRTATLLKKEIERDPKNIYYIYQLSRSYEMHGDTKEAIVELEKYLSLMKTEKLDNSFKINYYHNATIIYYNAKKYDKCIYYCKKMKELDEELIDCYYLMARCYLIDGNIDEAVENIKLYLKYIKTFKYEKYAKTNGLEVFSFADKYKAIAELIRIKIKINQLDNIEEYILHLSEDEEMFNIMISEILTVYVTMDNISAIDNVIVKMKKDDNSILLLYLLSKKIYEIKDIDREVFIKKLNVLDIKEKELLIKKTRNEGISSFLNLLEFISENSQINKVIKLETCIIELIDTLNEASIKEIIKSDFKNEIIYIIQYLLEKSDMIINAYLVDKHKIMRLLNQYELIIKSLSGESFKDDREFIKKLDEFKKYINEKKIVEALSSLKDSINKKNEFTNLVAMIKDSLLLDYIEYNNRISINDIVLIKKNLITLIDNNMFNEAIELFNQLEELYNIKGDSELLSIKATLKFYKNEISEAEKILKESLQYYDTNIDLLYNLAYIYEINEKYLSAISIYSRIMEIDHKNLYSNEIKNNLIRLKKIASII